MTKVLFLEALRDFTRGAVHSMEFPAKPQPDDPEPEPRVPEVYLCRVPSGKQITRKVPYILHQVVTSRDAQPKGGPMVSSVTVRSVFVVFDDDEQAGGLALLTLMDHFRTELLKQCVIARQYRLNLEAGVEYAIYTEDTAPFYAGEMITEWEVPAVAREVLHAPQPQHAPIPPRGY